MKPCPLLDLLKIIHSARYKAIVTCAILSLTLFSCVDPQETPTDKTVQFYSEGIGPQIIGGKSGWNAGDKIGVYMKPSGQTLANASHANILHVAKNTAANPSFVPVDTGINYPYTGAMDFIAYYPYKNSNELKDNIYPINTTNQANLSAIDLLYGVASKSGSDRISVPFKHALSKIKLYVNRATNLASLSGVTAKLEGFFNTADFDLSTGTIGNFGTTSNIITMQTLSGDAMVLEAIVIPQNSPSGAVIFTIGGQIVKLDLGTSVFEVGKEYKYWVTLFSDPRALLRTSLVNPWEKVDTPIEVNPISLPKLEINLGNSLKIGEINREDWVPANYILSDENGALLLSATTEIKGRGNSTWAFDKKSFSLKLTTKSPLLNMSEHKRWALLANHSDKTLLRTEVAFKMGKIFDNMAWTSGAEQIELYVNGAYRGVYQLVEAIKIDEGRVNIDKISAKKPNGGYLLEVDVRKGEVFNFTTKQGLIICCSDPDDGLEKMIEGDERSIFDKIKADVQQAETALYATNFKDPELGYRKYIDVDAFVDWYLVNEITKNNDAVFYSSVYLYFDPAKEKFCMGPIWDFDISLGNCDQMDGASPENFYIKKYRWTERIFKDPYFVEKVKERWNEKKNSIDALLPYIDERARFLDDAQKRNFERWDILGSSLWPNVVITRSYQSEIDYMKSFLQQRIAWLDAAINNL